MEPELAEGMLGAIFSPRETVVDTFDLVYAQAENCAANGVEFILNCKVTGMEVSHDEIQYINTTQGRIKARWVINAAGLHSDEISRMAEGEIDFTVHPRKGQFLYWIRTRVVRCRISLCLPPPPTRGASLCCPPPTAICW